jgi:hypothetical protein
MDPTLIITLLPLIISAASAAYETFVERPAREARTAEELRRREAEFKEWQRQYEEFLRRPLLTYPPAEIELTMRGLEEALARYVGEIRPQILRDLAARGVLSSGIAEYPLMQLERERLARLSEARRQLELQRLLAERTEQQRREAEQQAYLAAQLEPAYTTFEQARQAALLLPEREAALQQALMQQLGVSAAYALSPLLVRPPQQPAIPTLEAAVLSRTMPGIAGVTPPPTGFEYPTEMPISPALTTTAPTIGQ